MTSARPSDPDPVTHHDRVELYWIPLGAGGRTPLVRWNGRVYERLCARRERRRPMPLFHAALQVWRNGVRHAIEMTPAWGSGSAERGVVRRGAVGMEPLGRSALFRYEVRCWPDGVIPDLGHAIGRPCSLSHEPAVAERVIARVHEVPMFTWGRVVPGTPEMWNSNSVVAWSLTSAGLPVADLGPPDGRAPGWLSGVIIASR